MTNMTFDALYETENENDAGWRIVPASSLAEAKALLHSQIIAEGNHGAYRLDSLTETAASFKARRAAEG